MNKGGDGINRIEKALRELGKGYKEPEGYREEVMNKIREENRKERLEVVRSASEGGIVIPIIVVLACGVGSYILGCCNFKIPLW